MLSNDKSKYPSPSEWLAALRKDELWLNTEEELLSSDSSGREMLRKEAVESLGKLASTFWKKYKHNVEKTIQELADSGMTRVNMKLQAISLLTLEWLEQHASGGQHLNTKEPPSVIVDQLKPIFFGSEVEAKAFLESIQGMKPKQITNRVNQLVREKKISEFSSHRDLWTVLHEHGFYDRTESNWNMQVK